MRAMRDLGVDGSRPAIAHASLSSFGRVHGGAQAVVGALLEHFHTVIMPTFTYKTMIVPETGPANNAAEYGARGDGNRMADFYTPDMPADRLMGTVPETLRQHRQARRSMHPVLSFSGVNAEEALKIQTLNAPLASIAAVMEENGWVVLLGVRHIPNTSIHLGERLAGRKTFTRWALTPDGIVECPGFPSCSDGFEAIAPRVKHITRETAVGNALVRVLPLRDLVEITRQLVTADPLALLCDRPGCGRCEAVKKQVVEKVK